MTVEGTNPDGEVLTEGYEGRGKELEQVMDELTDRAVEMGWLHPGGQITLTLDAEDGDWVAAHSDSLPAHLNEYLDETLQVTIRVDGGETGGQEAAIPVGPPSTAVPTAAPTATPAPTPAGIRRTGIPPTARQNPRATADMRTLPRRRRILPTRNRRETPATKRPRPCAGQRL